MEEQFQQEQQRASEKLKRHKKRTGREKSATTSVKQKVKGEDEEVQDLGFLK